ncbi:MAG TPA: hypothetical protein VLB46_04375 [Pyrinomonadaceae bacterium]|nr:hypothetical protein [Pyrinomonadaceae bacterium]
MLDDVVARRFLLGQLPPEEQGRIEELAFEDPDTFTFLESVENDLIDEFIHGDLSVDEEQQFKSHFLSLPGRLNNLKVSRLLQRHFNKAAAVSPKVRFSFPGWFKQQSAWSQIAIAAAVVGLIVFAVWIFIRTREAEQPTPMQAGPDRPIAVPSPEVKVSPSPEPAASPVHVENKPKSVPPKQKRVVTYAVLSPLASTRGEGAQSFELAPDTPSMTIGLALITQRNFRRYEATLKKETDTVLHHWAKLKVEELPSGKALTVDIPVALLKPQESYLIVVSGVSAKGKTEVIAQYPFQVRNP